MSSIIGMACVVFQCGRVLCGYGGIWSEVVLAFERACGAFHGHMFYHILGCLGIVSVVYSIVYLADVL